MSPAPRTRPRFVPRGRRLVVGVLGVALMFLLAGLALRTAGGEGDDIDDVDLGATPGTIEVLTADPGGVQPGEGIEPGEPPLPEDPVVPPRPEVPLVEDPAVTLPPPGVITIPLPDFSAGQTSGAGSGTTRSDPAPAFGEKGVWVVKADGSSPILVARNATAGVAAGGTWVAFVEGGTVRAVRRTDLRAKRDLATGVGGTAALGLPISGGRGGVAFVRQGRVVLVNPASPGQPAASFPAPGVDAVAAEEDGEGRLVWADDGGIHVGAPGGGIPADVERGMLVMGHGMLASLQGGRVRIQDGPSLVWGAIDRLQTGSPGLVAGSGGSVRLRTPGGDDRAVLARASTPVVTASRILYVSEGRSLASAGLAGMDSRVVARAPQGRTITNLDLLDDATVVVTVG